MRKIGEIFSFLIPVIALGVLLGFMAGCEKARTEKNKAILLRCEELWNTGNLAIADEIFTSDFVNHDPNAPEVSDLEGYKAYVVTTRTGFPDFHVTIEDMIAEGDKVVSRWIVRGTHQGELFGIPPTGKQATCTGINIYRFADGKIVEAWWSKDMLGLLQQLGIVPAMGREDFTWGEPSELGTAEPCDPEKAKVLYLRELEMWNEKNLDIADEVFAEDFVNHDPSWPGVVDLTSYKKWTSDMLASAPDMNFTVDFMVVEGDKVAGRWSGSWTDTVGMFGNPPTGKKITVTGIDIIRCADGKIVERWWAKDVLGVMQQLGVIPPLPARGRE